MCKYILAPLILNEHQLERWRVTGQSGSHGCETVATDPLVLETDGVFKRQLQRSYPDQD